MPLGKQAAPGIFSFLFPDGCGKAQDAHPRPFSFFFPSGFICGFCFYKHCSHLFPRWELLCFPFPAGLGGEQGRPSVKIRRCITEELSLAVGKIFRAFQIVPPSLRAVWESPWGLNFHEIRNIKNCSHLFSSMGAFVFPIPCGIGGKDGATPLQKCIGA